MCFGVFTELLNDDDAYLYLLHRCGAKHTDTQYAAARLWKLAERFTA